MLIVAKQTQSSVNIYNTDTGTEFSIPTHWLQEDVSPGDVIKVIVDEVSTQRLKNEAKELSEKYNIEFE